MDDALNKATTPQEAMKQEMWHLEQERRSQDTIRVFNPFTVTIKGKPFNYPTSARIGADFATNGDYYVTWYQGRFRVPFNSTADHPRYIAEKFTREFATYVINAWVMVEGQKLIDSLSKNQPQILLDKYVENEQIWNKLPKTDDQGLLNEIYPQLQLGLVHKHGLDAPADLTPQSTAADNRSPQQIAFDQLGERLITDDTVVMSKQDLEKAVVSDEVA